MMKLLETAHPASRYQPLNRAAQADLPHHAASVIAVTTRIGVFALPPAVFLQVSSSSPNPNDKWGLGFPPGQPHSV